MRMFWTLLATLAVAVPAQAQAWYAKAVKGVEAEFVPATAKPGQTVTFRLTVRLNDGYHTYPTAQEDKAAANFVNRFTFPAPGAVVFVGPVADPAGGTVKADADLMVKALRELDGAVVYERKAVVVPTVTAGSAAVKLPAFVLSVCDKDHCFPAKTLTPEATLTVLPGPAVAVDPEFADEVAKAGGK